MTAYQYIAEDLQGEQISGIYEDVPDRDHLREDLGKLGYRLIQARRVSRKSPAVEVKRKIRPAEIVAFIYEFAGMFTAGLSVVRCLETMEEQTANEAMQTVLSEVRQSIETGAVSVGVRGFLHGHARGRPDRRQTGADPDDGGRIL